MNERQLEVQKANLSEEKKLLKQLKDCYEKAAKDCADKIASLGARTDLENIQTIVYQQQYQQAIKKQLDSILDLLQTESFTDISTYLQKSYVNGYTGALYDLQGQGFPLLIPIKQDEVVHALQNNPKLVKPYYDRLGEDVEFLKKATKAQVSRGIANGSSWAKVANELAQKMTSPFSTALYNSMRIARTEGHRIQQQSQWDALNHAKEKGCDVVKQWDSTLDGRTRTTHRLLDGQIRELDEYFEVDGKKAKYPGAFGRPEEDIHCRCCMLQRAKWALDEEELQTLKERAAYFCLDKSDSFDEFQKKFLKLPPDADKLDLKPAITGNKKFDDLVQSLQKNNIEYKPVYKHFSILSETERILRISGGDETSGSCASVALAYIGQKHGMDVLDFRDGASRDWFSGKLNKLSMWKSIGASVVTENSAKTPLTNGKRILSKLESGKEYYLSVGSHASIVRLADTGLQYLELQSSSHNGWKPFNADVKITLQHRFGCSASSRYYNEAYLTDIEQLKDNERFKTILGFINTNESEQKKGSNGTVK